MKKLIVLIFVFVISQNVIAQSGWFNINSPTNDIRTGAFINVDTGFFVGNYGKMYRTDNGGLNWRTISYRDSSVDYGAVIKFVNTQIGFISTYIPGKIYKTTNGGNNWNQLPNPFGESIKDFYFIDSNIGYAVASNKIYKTENGGINWSNLNQFNYQNYTVTIYSVTFIDTQIGYVSGSASYAHFGSYGQVWITQNGGADWSLALNTSQTDGLFNNFILNSLTGYFGGSGGIIFKTYDGGGSWSSRVISQDPNVNSIFAVSESKIFVSGRFGFYNSIDGGLSWNTVAIPSQSYGKIFFPNVNTGYLIGSEGKLLKTTTGGNVFVSQISSQIPDKYSLHQNYPNPFNPSTKINYEIYSAGFVSLKVFDLLGKEVATLVNEKQNAGSYAVDFNSTEFNLPSGIYFYTLNAGEFKETKKMVLVK